MKSIALKDFLHYRYVSGVSYAPDGKHAAFVVACANEKENSYERRLYLWNGRSVKQLTDIGREGSFVWLDGKHLLFPAVRSAEEKKRSEDGEEFTAYYSLDITGGEALHAFTLPFACNRLIPLPGGKAAALGRIDKRLPDYYLMPEKARAQVAANRREEKDYEVFDEIPFWSNGAGVTNGTRQALFLVDTKDGSAQRVTEPLQDVEAAVALDGKVYYTYTEYESRYPLQGFTIGVLDPATGEAHVLLRNEKLSMPPLQAVGSRLLAFATDGAAHGLNENRDVWQVDTETGALTLLRKEEYSLYSSVGSDCRLGGGMNMQGRGEQLYHLTTREGASHLYCLEPDGTDHPVLEKDGSIDCITVHENSDLVLMVAMFDMRLQELYSLNLSNGRLTRLTHFNDTALRGKYVAEPEYMEIESRGLTIGGWVLKPKDYDPEKRYPAVLDIHGGPKTVYGAVFMHEMQLWANMGYFVFYCNPMGGDGRDNAFMDIRGHYGETDYANLMDFTDAVLAKYPQIDAKRMCETGGSYGGFMTNWIVGHTDRFCCAASQRSISNWLSFHGVSDIGYYFAADQCDATPYTDPAKMWEHSPLKYAAQAKTPTLFIHSDEDYRCPLPEGLQMYTALAEHGVPVRLCLFHGENHELSRSGKPLHRVRRLQEITDWFEKYSKE